MLNLVLCLLIVLTETEWERFAVAFPVLENWLGRGGSQGFSIVVLLCKQLPYTASVVGFLQVFEALLTLELTSVAATLGDTDLHKSLQLYRSVSGFSLLGCGALYVCTGVLCCHTARRKTGAESPYSGQYSRSYMVLIPHLVAYSAVQEGRGASATTVGPRGNRSEEGRAEQHACCVFEQVNNDMEDGIHVYHMFVPVFILFAVQLSYQILWHGICIGLELRAGSWTALHRGDCQLYGQSNFVYKQEYPQSDGNRYK